ncbi:N-acetyltransferase family protein [Ideonella sp.]|uniref:GNAT family N-acetyltransferase n=1 Tax=Ideonella sp. TaxID=1929293 RepID=UPI0035B3CCD3
MPIVRRAQPGDLEPLAALFDAYRGFYEQASDLVLARRFMAERMTRDESIVFVAVPAEGQALAGFCQLYPTFCSVEAAPIRVLYDLFVSPGARGQGLAGALMQAAEDDSRRAGCVRLDLSTAHTNLSAQALYESRGWKRDEVFRYYSLAL